MNKLATVNRILCFGIVVVMFGTLLVGCKQEKENYKNYSGVESEKLEEPTKNSADTSITCMSFNVQGINTEDYLPTMIRSPYIADYIHKTKFELVGLQEAGSQTYDWTKLFCDAVCKDGTYASILVGDEDEFKATIKRMDGKTPNSAGLMILYRTDRFELLERGAQKYSSTELQERYFQWAKFKDKITGREVYMTNTHWSIDWDDKGNMSAVAGNDNRTKQANELRAFWEKYVGNNVLFATGDYNCNQISDWLMYLGEGIYKEGNEAYGWKGTSELHIDNIFFNPQQTKVENYYLSDERLEMKGSLYRYSDHKPAILKVSYNN